jgi:hydroxymethylbilane synthase
VSDAPVSGAKLRIATRGSNLALWQAGFVAEQLRSLVPDLVVELVRVTTSGDRPDRAPLGQQGEVGIFTREIQAAVLDRRADVAVHSLKDLPTEPVHGMTLAAVSQRDSPWDALVLPLGSAQPTALRHLPAGARIGTGSLRRKSQILHWRPDLQFGEARGNVETRLRKLDDGEFDALILAEAGLSRLGLSNRISLRLAPPDLFPAVGQGVIGIECRSDDSVARPILERVNHKETFAAATAERCLLARLRAGCHAPVGVATTTEADRLLMEAVVLSPDGKQRLHAQHAGSCSEPVELGTQVADELLRNGAGPLIEAAEGAS